MKCSTKGLFEGLHEKTPRGALGGIFIGQNVKCIDTYIPRWLVSRNLDEAYNGVCVASGAQYKKNGLRILA